MLVCIQFRSCDDSFRLQLCNLLHTTDCTRVYTNGTNVTWQMNHDMIWIGHVRYIKYSNMAPRVSAQTSIFSVVFFVFKSLLGIDRQKKLIKITILTRKPRSLVTILMYRTWPNGLQLGCKYVGSICQLGWHRLCWNNKQSKYVHFICTFLGRVIRKLTTANLGIKVNLRFESLTI